MILEYYYAWKESKENAYINWGLGSKSLYK